jgi:hypothetical protein
MEPAPGELNWDVTAFACPQPTCCLRKVILPAHRNARRVAGTRINASDTLLLNSPAENTAAWRRFSSSPAAVG